MTTLIDRLDRTWTWQQVEAAILSIPLSRFAAAHRFGCSQDDGWKIARAQMSDDLRRALEAQKRGRE